MSRSWKLARTMSAECANKGIWHSQPSSAAISLRLDKLELAGSGTEPLAANSLQRLPNRKVVPFQIEIYPAQPECFAFAKPKPERHAVQCLEPLAFGSIKEFTRLFEIERFNLRAPNLRGVHELGDIAADETPLHSSLKRVPKNYQTELHCARRKVALEPFVHEGLNMLRRELRKPMPSERGPQVKSNVLMVLLICRRTNTRLNWRTVPRWNSVLRLLRSAKV